MQKKTLSLGKLPELPNNKIDILSAGTWFGDGGAALGIMPKVLWQKLLPTDEYNRLKFDTNVLLIRAPHHNILVDTGFGNRPSDKQKKIYQTSDYTLLQNLQRFDLKPTDINYVILSHLHFDHAGGIISTVQGDSQLTFPNAIHIIQKQEWAMAQNPDQLNLKAYNFKRDLQILEDSENLLLIDGDYQLTEEISLELVGGHSIGLQVVRIAEGDFLAYFGSDIFPLEVHKHLAVTAAVDLCRNTTFTAKQKIWNELQSKQGYLIFSHDLKKKFIQII